MNKRPIIATPEELLGALDAVLPGFKKHWAEEGDLWSDDDGSFTFHGLFMELTNYVRAHFHQMPEEKRQGLMDFVESLVLETGDQTYDALDNASCTCFLENLSGEPPLSAELRRYMGPKSTDFFNHWDFPTATEA